MKIVMLDAKTLGDDITFSVFQELGEFVFYATTIPDEVGERIKDAEVIVLNKIKINNDNLKYAKKLRLICITATGYDNVDLDACRERGIAVCNVVGYSTDSVAQITAALALDAVCHMQEYTRYAKNGDYTRSGVANHLIPRFSELSGKRWGIVGMGNIGKKVGEIAKAFGCEVVCNKRTKEDGLDILPLDELMSTSDIISLHLPLTDQTRGIISREMLAKIKDGAVIVNVARGAVWDEEAVSDEVKSGRITVACDVYGVEPFGEAHPFYEIKDRDNLIITPHMAWSAYEARVRCMEEIAENIKAFYKGNRRNRIV